MHDGENLQLFACYAIGDYIGEIGQYQLSRPLAAPGTSHEWHLREKLDGGYDAKDYPLRCIFIVCRNIIPDLLKPFRCACRPSNAKADHAQPWPFFT